MEYTRSFSVKIEHDTNKETYIEEFNNAFEGAEFLLNELSDDQRLALFNQYCVGCGSHNRKCVCRYDRGE